MKLPEELTDALIIPAFLLNLIVPGLIIWGCVEAFGPWGGLSALVWFLAAMIVPPIIEAYADMKRH